MATNTTLHPARVVLRAPLPRFIAEDDPVTTGILRLGK